MPKSKFVVGGFVFSVIWLIIGTVWLSVRNSGDARLANITARGSCRGQEDFEACLDAYHAANGGRPEIDWVTTGVELAAGLLVIWAIVFLLKLTRGKNTEA